MFKIQYKECKSTFFRNEKSVFEMHIPKSGL